MPATVSNRSTETLHKILAGRLSVSIEDAAAAIGVSRAYAYQLVEAGALRTFTLGRRRLVSVDAIAKFIAKRERAGAPITDAAREAGRRALRARREKEAAERSRRGAA